MMVPEAMSLTAMGAGVIIIGASAGISFLWAVGLKSIARQPELVKSFQTLMMIGAAFIEGAALFALVICMLLK